MRHYGIGHWTDFVRGLSGAEEAEMRRHLEEGCESCERVVTSLRRVSGTTDLDARLGTPSAPPPSSPALATERQVLDLVWDSARAPSLTGEDGDDGGRQLHFVHSEYELNARVLGATNGVATLSGRLQSRFQVDVGGLRVRVVADDRVLDASSTGELGDFELALTGDGVLELQISLADRRELIADLGSH